MALKLKPLAEQVVLITGASSGIGLATALAAARQGAKLVLVARNPDGLENAARSVESLGAEVMTAAVDVSNNVELERAADAAISRFGRIDTWVNNAGIGVWGKLTEVSENDSRRLFDTNFWGMHNGSRLAVKYLEKNGGALINLGSVAADVAFPLQSMYAATKSAIQIFTNGLRLELKQDKAPISVTLIKPAAIGTPFGNKARSYLKNEAQLPPPLYRPEEVAAAIVYAAAHPISEIAIGSGSRLLTLFYRLAPRSLDYINGQFLSKSEYKNEPAHSRADNLYEGRGEGKTLGTDLVQKPMRSAYTRLKINPALTNSLAALAGLAAAVLIARQRKPNMLEKRYYKGLKRDAAEQVKDTINKSVKALKRAA